MANSRYEIDKEFERRLSADEYNKAADYLNEAIYWYHKGKDDRVHDFLICAAEELKDKGEPRAAKVVLEYARFF